MRGHLRVTIGKTAGYVNIGVKLSRLCHSDGADGCWSLLYFLPAPNNPGTNMPKVTCSVCNSTVDSRTLVAAQKLDNHTLELIRKDLPKWEGKRGVCGNCLEQYRAKKFYSYLEVESKKLSEMEQ